MCLGSCLHGLTITSKLTQWYTDSYMASSNVHYDDYVYHQTAYTAYNLIVHDPLKWLSLLHQLNSFWESRQDLVQPWLQYIPIAGHVYATVTLFWDTGIKKVFLSLTTQALTLDLCDVLWLLILSSIIWRFSWEFPQFALSNFRVEVLWVHNLLKLSYVVLPCTSKTSHIYICTWY